MIFYSIFLFGLNLVFINAFPAEETPDVQEDTTNVRFYCINSSDKEYHEEITYKIGKAWVEAKDTNFCGVDWSGLAQDGYYDASQKHVKYVGTQIALFLKGLYNRKVTMDSISIAGHSLGAHVAGYAGKVIHELTKNKISTIFGLDPAGPFFTAMSISDFTLTKDNANFVQVLHTSSGTFGTSNMLGHADFIANDGNIQDKCVKNFFNADDPTSVFKCSHGFARQIFYSSFMNKCVGVSGIKEEKSLASKLYSKINDFFFGDKKGETEAKDLAEAKDATEDNEITPDAYGIKNHGISGVFKLRTTTSKPYCVKA